MEQLETQFKQVEVLPMVKHFIFRMASNPKPKQSFRDFNCKRAIVKTHPDRPVLPNHLEMQ
jgi:hypothetical protein